jgi:hypothetical protein
LPLVDDLEAIVIAPTLTLSAAAALWDVIIVGAGPAGSITARELARAGLQTLLVDQAAFPRDKVCGGCLNLRAIHTLKTLNLENIADDAGRVDQYHLGYRGRIAKVPIRLGVSVSRRVLDTRLIEAAIAAGVAFRPGTRARLLTGTGDTRVIELAVSGECITTHSKIVIAADGVGGRITAADGVATRVRLGSRIGAGTILTGAIPDGCIEMAVAAGGYVGVANVASGMVDVAAALEPAFIRQHATLGNAAQAIRREAGFAVACATHLAEKPLG